MVNRITPALPVQAYTTFGISSPLATHWKPATCAQVDCEAHLHGWATTVMPGSDDEALLLKAADGMIDGHRRRFTRETQPDGFIRYVFGPEQACFRAGQHRVPLERPEIYTRRGGDWRAATTGTRRYDRADQWLDDFATNQDRIATAQERG